MRHDRDDEGGRANTVRKHLRAFYSGLAVASRQRAAHRYHGQLGAYDAHRSDDVEALAHDAECVRLRAVRVKPGSGLPGDRGEVQAIALLTRSRGHAGVFVHRMFADGAAIVDLYDGFTDAAGALEAVLRHEDAAADTVTATCRHKRARLSLARAEAVRDRPGALLIFDTAAELYPAGTSCAAVPHMDVDDLLRDCCPDELDS